MAKIAQVSAKYIIHAHIQIEGTVDRPDVIGAVFGQTEGLLGSDLELRELQKSGRIGRIEVTLDTKKGKSVGEIIIPSSLDKAETSIVGAAIEIIERIGPCNAKVEVKKIEDIRITKRESVIGRAKSLLKDLMDNSMPDSQELSDEVAHSVRMMEIQTYGNEKLACGPGIEDSDEIIVVEGRADVLCLLKHGFKNVISTNGTGVPNTIVKLGKEKVLTLFVDGDRGGNLIVQEMLSTVELDYVTRAPDGKEVEELTKKELHKAVRSKITAEQAKLELNDGSKKPTQNSKAYNKDRYSNNKRSSSRTNSSRVSSKDASQAEKSKFSSMLESLNGSSSASILDDKLTVLGKVPTGELQSTIKSLGSGIHAVISDDDISSDLINVCERARVKFLIGKSSSGNAKSVRIYTSDDL